MIKNYLENLKSTIDNLEIDSLNKIADVLANARNNNKQIFVFGNGGSGSTASHMVCDFVKGCSYNKEKRFRMICLNDNMPTILAYSNDISFEEAFLEQLKNFLQPGDIVLAISGSGNSPNIIKAIEYAKTKGNIIIGFTGFNGGKLKNLADYSLNANIDDMQVSEDIHMIAVHVLYKIFTSC